jgi:hypothetical protein
VSKYGKYQDEPFIPGWNDEGERRKKYPPLEEHYKAFAKDWKAVQRVIKSRKDDFLRRAEFALAMHLLELARQRGRFSLDVSNADLQKVLGVGRTAILHARKVLMNFRIIRVDDGEAAGTWRCELLGPDGKPFPGETGSASQPRRIRGGKHGIDFVIR